MRLHIYARPTNVIYGDLRSRTIVIQPNKLPNIPPIKVVEQVRWRPEPVSRRTNKMKKQLSGK